MPLRRKRTVFNNKTRPPIDHSGFYPSLQRYLEYLKIKHYSPRTVTGREHDLWRLIVWCDERGLNTPQAITKPILERYQKHLYYYRKANGEPFSQSSQYRIMGSIKQYFKWLTRENELLYNPASEIDVPKPVPSLPAVLTETEIDTLLDQPDTTTLTGIRDRAMLELFYSTGIRRFELCQLHVRDVSCSRQTVLIREGKGGKDRLVPMGERAAHWIQRYQRDVRPKLLLDINEQTLFLNDTGEPYGHTNIGSKVKLYLTKADITTPGSCHLLRHSMATHMLERGADIRYIQAMLGHGDLSSTQIYTHVSIRKLQEIHAATHPAMTDYGLAQEKKG